MRAERDKLLTVGVNLAIRDIEECGAFVPFALALESNGDVISLETDSQLASCDDAINALTDGLRKMASEGTIRASAIFSDVNLQDKLKATSGDAIRVELDDLDSAPVTCYVPYAVRNSAATTETVVAVSAGASIFDA